MVYTVMIVDDSAMVRVSTNRFLRSVPEFEVVVAVSNGDEALKQLAEWADVDLILLDIDMPKMDGLEFLRHAKMKTKAKICVLSSMVGPGSAYGVKALELGADAVVAKPPGMVTIDSAMMGATELVLTMRKLVGA